MPTHILFCFVFVAAEILRGANGAPIIYPFDSSTIIEVNADKTIECKGSRPVTWVSEVRTLKLILGWKISSFNIFRFFSKKAKMFMSSHSLEMMTQTVTQTFTEVT